MQDQPSLRFGVDLVTFFHPGFWGVDNADGITARAESDPTGFWLQILDAVAESGVRGIELTFPPMDWKGAIAAFGSAEAFAAELEARDLVICSGFFGDPAHLDWTDPAVVDQMVASVEDYARFLASCGADVIVAGLPMMQTPAVLYDFDTARALAMVMNRLGQATAACGVKFAMHTEGHSIFSRARDIDLMLLLTDPTFVHFCPDTAHITLMGGDPLQICDRHHERIVIAHWKDAKGQMPADTPVDETIHDRHRPWFCGFGTGRVDWPGWMRLMRDRKITGWAILELDAAPDPVADLKGGLTLVNQALLPIYR